jgi:hypothetical protein
MPETERENIAQAAEPEADPFVGFQNEEYDAGARVEAPEGELEAHSDADEEIQAAELGTDADEADSPDAPEERPAKPKTAQERINELTRARREAERRAEALERRLQELEIREPEYTAPRGGDESTAPQYTAAPGAPDPNNFEFGELDSRYITALVDFQTTHRIAEFQRQQQQEYQHREDQQKFQRQVDNGSKKHADFYEKVVIGAERGAWPLSAELGKMLVESDAGADIAYHLASHPEEAAQVYRQSPVEQARYFGRMEAKFSAQQMAAVRQSAPPRTPRAPTPVLPARGAGGKFQVSADSDDFTAFERLALEK